MLLIQQPSCAEMRHVISQSKEMCQEDRINPLAASMGKDLITRRAWKNRTLEILLQREVDNYPT